MKTKKILSALTAFAMLPALSLPIFAANPITADEVRGMLFSENITTVRDCDALQETEYYNKQGRPSGPIKSYIRPEQAIRIHEEASDGSADESRKWLVKSATNWDGWYYLFINEGDYGHMNFNPVDTTANDGTSEAYFYLSTINDITDFDKIADALKDVDGITSIKFVRYTHLISDYLTTRIDLAVSNMFKIESADGTKYMPIQTIYDPYAAITDGEIKTLNAWTAYDADCALGFINDIGLHNTEVTESIYKEMGADYPFPDTPVEDTDTLSQYADDLCVFSDVSQTGAGACTQNQITAVNALVDLGFMRGYEDNTFRPWNTITRAEAAVMAYKLLELDESSPVDNELTDIDGHWAENEIAAVAAAGIINGYEDHSFRPDNAIEYRHFLKILLGIVMGFKVSVYEESEIITSAIGMGLTKDLGDFDPSDEIPRIHAAAAAARLLDSNITTNRISYEWRAGGSGSRSDITLMDFLNGKELHGLDLRLEYEWERFDEIRNGYDEIINNAFERLTGKSDD